MICKSDKCVGCGNCVAVCPVNAISMQTDPYGFIIAKLDDDKCRKCGRCAKVCPGLDKRSEFRRIPCYAAQTLDEEILKTSSSGGLFSVLASEIIRRNGVVCGAVRDEYTCYIHHAFAETEEELMPMRGSKYVQSDLQDVIINIIAYLNQGREVLFTGTPCQVAAVNKRVEMEKVDSSLLYTIDLVCHGTPNYQYFRDFLNFHEKKVGKQVKKVLFRSKISGWSFNKMYIQYANQDGGICLKDNYYHSYFGWGYIFRDSCYSCSKAGSSRVSDITLADFWGIQKYLMEVQFPGMDAGTSMVTLNTQHGKSLFESIAERVKSHPMDVMIACKENHQLERPSFVNQNRHRLILECYRYFGAAGVNTLYCTEKLFLKLKNIRGNS